MGNQQGGLMLPLPRFARERARLRVIGSVRGTLGLTLSRFTGEGV